MSAPERIWLEPCCDDAEVSWCVHKLDDCDECGEISHEYIRLDLHEAAMANVTNQRDKIRDAHDIKAQHLKEMTASNTRWKSEAQGSLNLCATLQRELAALKGAKS